MSSQRRIRVLLAKPGIDGHDVGIKVVASALRDAGMEVIYLGLRRTPEQVVSAALEEDCDVVGLNFHSFGHRTLVPEVVRLLREKGMEDVLLLAGGSILDKDAQELRTWGVSEVFGVGSRVDDIVRYIRENAR